jgi:hypothetical protein
VQSFSDEKSINMNLPPQGVLGLPVIQLGKEIDPVWRKLSKKPKFLVMMKTWPGIPIPVYH